MDANDLLAKDLDFEFTYESDDGTCRSWLDHVLVSFNVLHRIHKIQDLKKNIKNVKSLIPASFSHQFATVM